MALGLLLALTLLLGSSQATTDGNGTGCSPPTEPDGFCDTNYTIIEEFFLCVYATSSQKTFEDAQAACRVSNANLVEIKETLLEFDVGDLLEEDVFYWIGLHSPEADDVVVWISDNSSLPFELKKHYFSESQQPSSRDKSKNNCVGKYLDSKSEDVQTFVWADCKSPKGYICSKPSYNAPSTPSLTVDGIVSGPIKVYNGTNVTVRCQADVSKFGDINLVVQMGNQTEKLYMNEKLNYKEEFITDTKSLFCKRVGFAEMTLEVSSELDERQLGCFSYKDHNGVFECSETDPHCTLTGKIELLSGANDNSLGDNSGANGANNNNSDLDEANGNSDANKANDSKYGDANSTSILIVAIAALVVLLAIVAAVISVYRNHTTKAPDTMISMEANNGAPLAPAAPESASPTLSTPITTATATPTPATPSTATPSPPGE